MGDEMDVTVGPTESAYCILENPLGQTTRLKEGKCRWTATRTDAGRWKVLYSVPGNLREEEMNYTLTGMYAVPYNWSNNPLADKFFKIY